MKNEMLPDSRVKWRRERQIQNLVGFDRGGGGGGGYLLQKTLRECAANMGSKISLLVYMNDPL